MASSLATTPLSDPVLRACWNAAERNRLREDRPFWNQEDWNVLIDEFERLSAEGKWAA